MFNERVSWKAMTEDKYYIHLLFTKEVAKNITRLLQKIDNYGTIERKSGKHNNDVIVTSQSIAVNK